MKPLFTIHAGELLVGDYIEKNIRHVNMWVPSRDTGVDLLVTDLTNRKVISLQVKFSRDFLVTDISRSLRGELRACGWWSIKHDKIAKSKADYWVFVLLGFANRSSDFILIRPSELLSKFDSIHGRAETIQSYLWVAKNKQCWEARGLKRSEQSEIAQGRYTGDSRDFSEYLNQWAPIHALGSG
jgi:hypothetical protein